MKKIVYSTRFKKDVKRYRNNPKKMSELLNVFRMLEKGETLPPKYKAHELKGDYAGCMECHVEGDMLLVWIDYDENTINAYRLGSHAELFGKGTIR